MQCAFSGAIWVMERTESRRQIQSDFVFQFPFSIFYPFVDWILLHRFRLNLFIYFILSLFGFIPPNPTPPPPGWRLECLHTLGEPAWRNPPLEVKITVYLGRGSIWRRLKYQGGCTRRSPWGYSRVRGVWRVFRNKQRYWKIQER